MGPTMVCGACGLQLPHACHFCPRCGTSAGLAIPAQEPGQNQIRQGCLVCGVPLVCPACVCRVPTTLLPPPANVWAPISGLPPLPLHRETPTAQQIACALVSKHNPYAHWGTLVIDESEQALWQTKELFGSYELRYHAGSFVIESCTPQQVWMVTPVRLDNFAYQVLVAGGPQSVGLLFRANRAHTCYYQLVKEGTWLKLYLRDGNTQRQLYQFRSQYQQWYAFDGGIYKHKPVLLGIVAQGAVIDVYENLRYLGRAEDDHRSSGEIGLCTATTGSFSHIKVWKQS